LGTAAVVDTSPSTCTSLCGSFFYCLLKNVTVVFDFFIGVVLVSLVRWCLWAHVVQAGMFEVYMGSPVSNNTDIYTIIPMSHPGHPDIT
jgi:hypothetical protein